MKQKASPSWWHGLFKAWFVLWLLGAVGLGAAYRLVLYPKQQYLQSLKGNVRHLSGRLTQLQQAQSSYFREKLSQSLEDKQSQCDRLLFTEMDLNRLDFRLAELARNHDVNAFESSNIFEKSDKYFENLKRVGQRQIVTQCEAGFPQFLRFLNALERNDPVLFVSQLGLTCPFDPKRQPAGQIECFALHVKDAIEEDVATVAKSDDTH